ncbi:MAG: hypothetical protein DME18_13645 [Verrucomicrobia bacterium]|nr:MAG: hypothetical protein DME18_13645 [Verrucomicrobiota bacterium]
MKPARLQVAAVQMKFRATIHENVERIIKRIKSAARDGADAILFPECAVKGLDPGPLEKGLSSIARAAGDARCNVLVGSPTFRDGKWFNSLLVFDRRGRRTFQYSKIHLTPGDARFFTPGNALALFRIDGIPATAIICHERRYPELVRLPVMMGARIVFHSNAGLDSLRISQTKRRGRDGIAVRAFENQVYYVFANSVGPQGNQLWSAGDSKIVAPDSRLLALANNRDERVIQAKLDLAEADGKYAREALNQPAFLRDLWRRAVDACRRQLRKQQVK